MRPTRFEPTPGASPLQRLRAIVDRVTRGPASQPHHPHAGFHHPTGTAGDAVAPRHHGATRHRGQTPRY